ncbi:MAG: biosynthetic-type acetolactate synthase large subunit [Acidobacteria bacterium]|nr:biosynthetic-type acetolactate synthase large subunit [Acidobacteriota bacterium]
MRGARIVCEALMREGVDTIFGYPGGVVLPIYDELLSLEDKLKHILVRHEQGAMHMAEGYAKATGKVGVVLVTSGPGATNTVTGIANAYMDSTPIVIITGQVPCALIGNDAFQEVDTVGITRPCTKYNYLVREARELPAIIKEAFHLAQTGRPGPVLIDIPKDVCMQNAPFIYPEAVAAPGYEPQTFGEVEKVKQAVAKMLAARRPVLYIGGGVIHANAFDEVVELAESLALPVTPTLMGLGGFPSGHPLALGMLGMHGMYWANMAISEADLIVAIGARFDDRVTGALNKFAPRAEIIHVDIDPTSISKNVRAHIGITGDARSVLRQMLAELKAGEIAIDKNRLVDWWAQIEGWKAYAPLKVEKSEDVIMPQHLIHELHRLTKGDAIITTDVGQHQMWLAQHYPFNGPRQNITSGGLGTMGFGFPAALGAQLAHPEKQVIAFVGDGGFQMTSQELATAVLAGANVKIIIMNNNFLGMVRQLQDMFYDKKYASVNLSGNPDFVKLAEAYGATGLRATHPDELRDVLARGLATPGVVVMDIVVAENLNVYPMVPAGAGLKEMILN